VLVPAPVVSVCVSVAFIVFVVFVLCVVGVSSPNLWMTAGVERPPVLLLVVPPWSSPACGVGVLLWWWSVESCSPHHRRSLSCVLCVCVSWLL